jgi:uncharacterized membrane protein
MCERQGRAGGFPQSAKIRASAKAAMNDTSRTQPARLEFRIRGREMNRIEAVSDVVFGFALTLLVVSGQVPHTYAELIDAMRAFPAFALTFAMLMVVWARHYYFFRHYGLDDAPTIVLNTLLLFVVVFYVYPLKFLFTVWLAPLTGMQMRFTDPNGAMHLVLAYGDTRGLMLIFGSGYVAVYLDFAALVFHAHQMRDVLGLDAYEIAYTKNALAAQLLNASVGVVSILVALLAAPAQAGYAGYIYFLVPLFLNIHGRLWRRRRRAMEMTSQALA